MKTPSDSEPDEDSVSLNMEDEPEKVATPIGLDLTEEPPLTTSTENASLKSETPVVRKSGEPV